MKIYNLLDKSEFLNEVAVLEYEEWADNKEFDREKRLKKKKEQINKNLSKKDFCKLILAEEDELVGFISLFPFDGTECIDLTPWYATMYVKKGIEEKAILRF